MNLQHGWFDIQNVVIFPTGLQFQCEVPIDCFVKKILFAWFYFIFIEARFDQFIQDLIYLFLVALALIAIDIATNRWCGLRAETKTAALLI